MLCPDMNKDILSIVFWQSLLLKFLSVDIFNPFKHPDISQRVLGGIPTVVC